MNRYRHRNSHLVAMPDDGGPPRKQLAHRSKKRKPEEYEAVKLEPDYQVRRTNPWRLSGFGSHDTIQWLPRPYLPWP